MAQHQPSSHTWRFDLCALVLLSATIGVVYGRAIHSPFLFDDGDSILSNASLTKLWPLIGTADVRGPLNPRADISTSGRSLVNFSLALNYQAGGLNPVGYRFFNFALHVLSAMLLMFIIRRTLQLPYFAGKFDQAAFPLSLITALLWAIHPLQVEAVIYVTQRTELMVGFFYFAVLYCSLRSWTVESPASKAAWAITATLACLAGMACKEVMATAPLMVLLFDRTFITGTFQKALRRSRSLYIGLATGWLLLALLNYNQPRSSSAGFHLGVSPITWWLTQIKVLLMYLKLIIWPWPLLIHYDVPYLDSIGIAWPWLLAGLILALCILLLLYRRNAVGFVGAWVVLILAPTLVVPIITEVAAERRMYLPLAAVITLLVAAAYSSLRQALQNRSPNATATSSPNKALLTVAGLSGVLVVIYSLVDVHRLSAFADSLALWTDTANHEPNDPVAQDNLGRALHVLGRNQEAKTHYELALQLKPDYPACQDNYGFLLMHEGDIDAALAQFQAVLKLHPDDPSALFNLGATLTAQGKPAEAIEQFQHLLSVQPDFPWARFNLGNAYYALGQLDAARQQYELQLQQKADLPEVHNNLANTLKQLGQPQPAIEHYNQALRLKPDYVDAHNNYGNLLSDLGRWDEATQQFQQAAALQPNSAEAHFKLAVALFNTNNLSGAAQQFQQSLKLRPDDAECYSNLALTYSKLEQPAEAIQAAETGLTCARTHGQADLAQQLETWLTDYRNSHPTHDSTAPNSQPTPNSQPSPNPTTP